MTLSVYNIYSGATNFFSGEPDQVRNQLLDTFPFLKRYANQSLQEDISKLSEQQAFMVKVENE